MFKKKHSLKKQESDAGLKEEEALRQFKEKISDLITSQDVYSLKKWLQARNYDVTKAEAMFRTSMAYREKMKVDTLLTDYEPPEVLKKYMSGGNVGHDKEGSPVRVELFGHLDMKGLMYSARKSDLEKVKLKQCEQHLKDWEIMSKKLNRRVDGLVVIFDMEGVSSKMLWRPGLQMYLHLVSLLEDNYPEMLKRMFVINAPRIFPLLYKLCRPLISQDTKNKIHVLGSDYTSTLLKYIDADELPAYLGGNKTDPDGNPRCTTLICQGGQVPEEYYLKECENSEQMENATVARGDKLSIDLDVTKAGSVLRWEFKTDGYDIGFGVFRQEGPEKVTVVEPERVNSHMVPEDGNYTCDVPGKYTLVFDNSFSWTRDKAIQYSVEIIQPIDQCLENEIINMVDSVGTWTGMNEGAGECPENVTPCRE
ncbi:retinal-binding protein-like isoform X1 [Biomphalaria pfeifferi]|uniref:Retinal-binding protein-like isoform X1 n=1 Tax=Biomphalaria pfeifferi TaxID=112525 RepID=A0AAD8C9M4_BIOPF|nr:retinal-binding protein-like isoform X1 [Biomphalaria pfeifferi]